MINVTIFNPYIVSVFVEISVAFLLYNIGKAVLHLFMANSVSLLYAWMPLFLSFLLLLLLDPDELDEALFGLYSIVGGSDTRIAPYWLIIIRKVINSSF
jgi:hypothetical protein